LAQAAPHAPQFAVVDRVVSQPFDARPSQLPNPLLHAIAQVEELHDGVPWLLLQARPHPPQLVRLFAVSVSQPLLLLPSQSAKLPVHTGVHTPVTQDVAPCAFVHELPQAPQFVRLLPVLVSQPFAVFASQSANPAKQVGEQTPPAHDTVPFAFEQLFPHPPQFDVLVFRLDSQPFPALPSQFANPELQVGVQAPAAQAVAPLAFVQAFPQAPQFVTVI